MREILKRKIVGKMGAIKRNEITPRNSGIANLLNRMKTIDEFLYINLLDDYKKVLNARKII